MKLRSRMANYLLALAMQWAILFPGALLILKNNPEVLAYTWLFVAAATIPPLFTAVLYNKWVTIVDEKCFHLSRPFRRKKPELYFEEVSEIILTTVKGEEIIKVLKDRDSNLYPFGRLLAPKDSARLWKYLSQRIEELGLDVEIKRE